MAKNEHEFLIRSCSRRKGAKTIRRYASIDFPCEAFVAHEDYRMSRCEDY